MSGPVETQGLAPVSCFRAEDHDAVLDGLRAAGSTILGLDGRDVVDKASFLARVERDLPMPAGLHPGNWDALADCLWGGLVGLDSSDVAVVWTHVDELLGRDLTSLLVAVGVFTDTIRAVSTTDTGFPRPLRLRLVLLGDGAMFGPSPPEPPSPAGE